MKQTKKEAAINTINFNIRMYNMTALVVVFTLLLIIVHSVTSLIDYIPKISIVILLAIVSILVVVNFYISKKISTNAIDNMEEYEEKMNHLLTKMEREMESQKLMYKALEVMSFSDELTGLHNRHGFMVLAKQYLRTLNRNNAIVYMFYANINNMKQINDTYGHQEGNSVIKRVADILNDVYSGSDLISRIGDGEFVVLPAGFTESEVALINNRLQEKLDEVNSSAEKDYIISISFGVAGYNPAEPSPIEDLLMRAEKLMYEHKKRKDNA